MANTDPEALKAAQLAYERSNSSGLVEEGAALDPSYEATRGGDTTHPEEPILTRAEDAGLVEKAREAAAKKSAK